MVKYEKAVQASVESARLSTTLFIENRAFADEYFDQWLKVKLKISKNTEEYSTEWNKVNKMFGEKLDSKVGGASGE